MTTITDSTTVDGPLDVEDFQTLIVASGVVVEAPDDAVVYASGKYATVINAGMLVSDTLGDTDAVILTGENSLVTNMTGALIQGRLVGVGLAESTESIVNDGTVVGTDLYGIFSTAGDASISNRAHGIITGGKAGIFFGNTEAPSLVVNHGAIDSASGSGILIDDGNAEVIKNFGTIGGALAGITSTEAASATRIYNYGSIDGITFDNLQGANLIHNHGHIQGDVQLGASLDTYDGHGDSDIEGTVFGNGGRDVLIGGRNDDTFDAGAGNDELTGGKGDDDLTGGTGKDVFVFKGHFGDDVINDFKATSSTHDYLEFSPAVFADFAAVKNHMKQVGTDVVITHADDSIVLHDVKVADLVAHDFLFI
jgi:Ca2+-binding RTX toxin-like protein